MRIRSLVLIGVMSVVMASSAAAQQQPASAPVRVVEPPAPAVDQPNIQFDIAIADEGGGLPASKKSVTMMVQGGGSGSLRSTGVAVYNARTEKSAVGDALIPRSERTSVELNVDVKMPRHDPKEPSRVRARVAIEYQPFHPDAKVLPAKIRAQNDVMLDSGKKTTLWQNTDPVSGLRTTIEVTATVLK